MDAKRNRRRQAALWYLRWVFPFMLALSLTQLIVEIAFIANGDPGSNGGNYFVLVLAALQIVVFSIGWIYSTRGRRKALRETGKDPFKFSDQD